MSPRLVEALRSMSSLVMIVTPTGRLRFESSKRVAVMTTASCCAKAVEKAVAAARPRSANRMENLSGVIPDAALVEKAFQAGLRTRGAFHPAFPRIAQWLKPG